MFSLLSKDFRGSEEMEILAFWLFSLPFPEKKQGKEDQGGVRATTRLLRRVLRRVLETAFAKVLRSLRKMPCKVAYCF